jgi:putative transport protein
MWQDIVKICQANPQIVIFLSVAIGYAVGKVKIKGISLGSTTGVLIVALILGQITIEVPAIFQAVFFALFMFSIGYKVGPQFFGGLKKEGLHYLMISVVVALSGLAMAIILGKAFGFDKGTTAGLLGGAMTQSSVIGTAQGAINQLAGITDAQKTSLDSNVAVAYAITYVFGTAGLVFFFRLLPKLLRIDLRAEAKAIEKELSGGDDDTEGSEFFSWHKSLDMRAYKAANKTAVGKKVAEIEEALEHQLAIDRIKRGGKIVESTPEMIIEKDDVLVLIGKRPEFPLAVTILGPEVDDKKAEDITGEILSVCVTKKEVIGRKLGSFDRKITHGVFLRKIIRQGHEIPIAKNTIIEKCDVLEIAGSKEDVERLVGLIGYPERPTIVTDLITVATGCFLGTLVGLLAFKVGGIPITLGVGGGVLVAGLVFGWLRSLHPTFGQIPGGAQWIFSDLGLNLFIAGVGLSAGPQALSALKTTGGSIFIAGVILTLFPIIMGLIYGKLFLKMNPALLFGALCGAETVTAALNSVREVADSNVPTIGYTVCYAFGNVILTIWGSVLINIM